MENRYVLLTGSKNNAGDYLIKYRAKQLFSKIRPDREILDLDAWKAIDSGALAKINESKALILMGGPSLHKRMYPGIYRLTSNLNDIKAPITTMGIGWQSAKGRWKDTYRYPLTATTISLLDRIRSDGLPASVRDYHTLNALRFHGYDDFLMTGCPAYYDLSCLNQEFRFPDKLRKVAFSLGVSFINSASMERQMKEQVLSLKQRFNTIEFEVVFHHSLDRKTYSKVYDKRRHNIRHNKFADWLSSRQIDFVDISGSAENLIDYYGGVDLHVGYRVHAHIFMNSIKKPSLLISEDGRAKGAHSIINGMFVDGYHDVKDSLFYKALNRIGLPIDRFSANCYSTREIEMTLDYGIMTSGSQNMHSSILIDNNFLIMETFLKDLP